MKQKLTSGRRTSLAAVAAGVTAAAMLLAAGGSTGPLAAEGSGAEVVTAAPRMVAPAPPAGQPNATAGPTELVRASRSSWRVVPPVLPVGLAPERGLQVKTILVSRTISDMFPEIQRIGGVRPDALRWHPNGLALDVMIPNPGSAEGIALGDQIVAFVLENAERFSLQDAIWRGAYYTPRGPKRGASGHYDHVHITTKGGGYPTGGEIYFR